ncbi:hypothetical protein [Nocardioides aurantiacus]|uniref:Uncharacterized protein n=1 Tax=Nocardioides aurantiacus TaxID=86796 RepID=A0A3N2CUL2_9ACTN|nr:hypothetical protein [Nocardioides aurantiacus]ROR91146.1 hypothetical protein EDD33_2007 [Nocardioides aurantiacus]
MKIAEFHQYMRKLQDGYDFPVHVSRRLHAFLGNEEQPVFADASVQRTGWHALNGQVVVFTQGRVLLATLSETSNRDVFRDDPGFTVVVQVWPRRFLMQMAMTANEDKYENSDYEWTRDYEDHWPRGARVALTYRDHGIVTVPLGDPNDDVAKGIRSHLHSLGLDLDGA